MFITQAKLYIRSVLVQALFSLETEKYFVFYYLQFTAISHHMIRQVSLMIVVLFVNW